MWYRKYGLGILLAGTMVAIALAGALRPVYGSSLNVAQDNKARMDLGIGTWFGNWYPSKIPDVTFEMGCDHAAELSARVARVAFRWDVVEPSKGTFRWDVMDYIVGTVASRANPEKILVVLENTAPWAAPPDSGEDFWRTPPTDIQGYKDYLMAVVSRYKDRVGYWEIWNEPNLNTYWLGTTQDYVTLLQASYQAIKTASPSAKVLGGVVSGADYQYVTVLYNLGARPYFDILSLHPYSNPYDPRLTGTPEKEFYPTVGKVLGVMAANGDQEKDVWFTELAWAMNWSHWGGVTEEQQAEYMKASYDMASANWPQVKAYVWFSPVDTSDGNWGVYNSNGSKRSSFFIFRGLAGSGLTVSRRTPIIPGVSHDMPAGMISSTSYAIHVIASKTRTTAWTDIALLSWAIYPSDQIGTWRFSTGERETT